MPSLDDAEFNTGQLDAQLHALDELLAQNGTLSERDDVLPFFRDNRQIALALSLFHSDMGVPDRIGFEYGINGRFVADIVVGNSKKGIFLFVEVENPSDDSIFKMKGRNTSYWSPVFHDGFTQLVDWTYALFDLASEKDRQLQFGSMSPSLMPMLIIGRESALSGEESDRLKWHNQHVTLRSNRVRVLLFDEIVARIREKVKLFRSLTG